MQSFYSILFPSIIFSILFYMLSCNCLGIYHTSSTLHNIIHHYCIYLYILNKMYANPNNNNSLILLLQTVQYIYREDGEDESPPNRLSLAHKQIITVTQIILLSRSLPALPRPCLSLFYRHIIHWYRFTTLLLIFCPFPVLSCSLHP